VVGAVLTQNTAWTNVERAIVNLKQQGLLDLDRLAGMTPSRLAPIIRPAGFYRLKAKRLLSVLRWLRSRRGFPGILGMPTHMVRDELLGCSGVGPETADSILLYALDRPVFVVDAYTRRILYRYGLLQGDEGYSEVQSWFHRGLDPDKGMYNEFHALLVRLAKEHCRAGALCHGCPLS
jgi:endonuclease-3 related protein